MSATTDPNRAGWALTWASFAALMVAVTLAAGLENPSHVMGFQPVIGLFGALMLGLGTFRPQLAAAGPRLAMLAAVAACLVFGAFGLLDWAER